jgi:hypothetical protein
MTKSLVETFDKVWVINLDEQTHRWHAFLESLPHAWPFATPERFSACDGKLIPAPQWWKAGPGAWGCFRSHYRVLEDALNRGYESILVFEDDAVFVDQFATRSLQFMNAVPDDWNWVYFGGQHIEQEWGLPTRINPLVYRPHNVHRSHAYGLRGRKTIEFVYNHLNTPSAWRWGDHVDHRMGELHRNFPGAVYVPHRWLVGQRAGFSNIKRRELPTNFFANADTLVDLPLSTPMVAVVGEDDWSRELVARTLHSMCVTMGEEEPQVDDVLGFSATVAPGLDGILTGCFSSHGEPLSTEAFQISRLRWWANRRELIHRDEKSLLGGSHRLMALTPEALCRAWNRPRIVRVSSSRVADPVLVSNSLKQRLKAGLAAYDATGFREIVDLHVDDEMDASSRAMEELRRIAGIITEVG